MLEDDVLQMLRSLAPGWRDLFRRVAGIDLGAADLKTELQKARTVDRTVPGFEDFAPQSDRGIAPGDPALSLVYHALASPRVHPTAGGEPASPETYPDLADLDRLENYIWSLSAIPDLPPNAVVATFAYEYRPGPYTAHRRHADFVYGRTGVSRVGEVAPDYDPVNRCYRNLDGAGKFACMPARYGVFVAVPRKRRPTGVAVVGPPQADDDRRDFLLPVGKLFNGAAHVAGRTVQVDFKEYHRSEKLRRIFIEARLPNPPGLDGPPYVRDSLNSPDMIARRNLEGSVLLSAKPAPLARPAMRDGRIATFTVPKERRIPIFGVSLNRHLSSFMIVTGLFEAGVETLANVLGLDPKLRPRNAPEFVNIRHKVTSANGSQTIVNLNTEPPGEFEDVLHDGGFEAALYEDSTADGCVVAAVTGLDPQMKTRAAFSVMAAPDFFPFASEIDIAEWVVEFPSHNRMDQFKEGGPAPLCEGRLPVNPTLNLPGSPGTPAFDRSDETMVAIVSRAYREAAGPTQWKRPPSRSTTWMTDACSNEFAPGWDVTFADDGKGKFYATFGLGSPFLEDVKLCAAANAFWPAVSPDAGRTFHRSPTAIPLLDAELGYHAGHPNCPAAGPTFGWDGEQGPFIETVGGGAVVNFADISRSDYLENASQGRVAGTLLRDVDSDELIDRMDCLRLCIQVLDDGRAVKNTPLWLIYASPVPDWTGQPQPPGSPALAGKGYRYEFVAPVGEAKPSADLRRSRQRFDERYVCNVTRSAIQWSKNGEPFKHAIAHL